MNPPQSPQPAPSAENHHRTSDPRPDAEPEPELGLDELELELASNFNSGGSSDSPGLSVLTRTPHPYHHPQFEILNPASRVVYRTNRAQPPSPLSLASTDNSSEQAARRSRQGGTATPTQLSAASTPRRGSVSHGSPFTFIAKPSRESTTTGSDSGTDADDEHFLKGLPAPRHRLHKGVRGLSEPASGAATPIFPPQLLLEYRDVRRLSPGLGPGLGPALGLGISGSVEDRERETRKARKEFLLRRAKVVVRRGTETVLLGVLALAVASNPSVRPLLRVCGRDMVYLVVVVAGLTALYPLRLAAWAYERGKLTRWLPINIFRSSFDPAPLLYPPAITMLTSLLTGAANPAVILPNLILSLSSIPHRLIPYFHLQTSVIDPVHWALTLLPLMWARSHSVDSILNIGISTPLDDETHALLYPIHQTTASVLRQITATSLLPAELQLVTTGLINLLLLSRSPQMMTLAGILWIGGVCTLVLSGAVIRWGISLARVPGWRFRRTSAATKNNSIAHAVMTVVSLHRIRNEFLGITRSDETTHDQDIADSSDGDISAKPPIRPRRSPKIGFNSPSSAGRRSRTHTPSGRRKRTTSVSLKPFLKLTAEQAEVRKWMYAAWVYGCGVATYLAGRLFLVRYVLGGYDPVCWVLAYLFGDMHRFRLEVLKLGWDRYIPLPPRSTSLEHSSGWVEHVRCQVLGLANTRLGIAAYFLAVMVVGFSIVFRLKHVYEVDTRRKGFHFVMVVWWLPTIFVDPTFVAVLYVANLAFFLIVDMLRASQLPPLSKPIATFIAPYVDGRDLAGPVVISPIFLAIGCAIPLWLSLASLPRTRVPDMDEANFTGVELPGWEVPTREVAMVTGVVCVGLGDAAASLIGRRWGHHKWLWGGSKSLEGSVAFVAAVFVGLAVARAWLVLGGWAATDGALGWGPALRNAGVCATVASVTEAALTGGNDNVIVPVILWTCVKGLGV